MVVNRVQNGTGSRLLLAAAGCDQLRREPARLAISARDRKAALTAAAFGNKSAISGSRTTTFELVWSRSTNFPRTSAPKSERLYSERRSSAASFLAFFIELPLCPRRERGGDDSNGVFMLRVRDHEEATRG